MEPGKILAYKMDQGHKLTKEDLNKDKGTITIARSEFLLEKGIEVVNLLTGDTAVEIRRTSEFDCDLYNNIIPKLPFSGPEETTLLGYNDGTNACYMNMNKTKYYKIDKESDEIKVIEYPRNNKWKDMGIDEAIIKDINEKNIYFTFFKNIGTLNKTFEEFDFEFI